MNSGINTSVCVWGGGGGEGVGVGGFHHKYPNNSEYSGCPIYIVKFRYCV